MSLKKRWDRIWDGTCTVTNECFCCQRVDEQEIKRIYSDLIVAFLTVATALGIFYFAFVRMPVVDEEIGELRSDRSDIEVTLYQRSAGILSSDYYVLKIKKAGSASDPRVILEVDHADQRHFELDWEGNTLLIDVAESVTVYDRRDRVKLDGNWFWITFRQDG